MSKYVTHLIKNGSGLTMKAACGRSIYRMSCGSQADKWDGFKAANNKCEKCENSKQADFNRRNEVAK
ncbi:hypothetical protein [Yersinia alsatica]|uniref:hypothetical protein n=1 Tax=Yersinia alsatica TaxID=2890317 RepID=UPI0011A67339|nr:hypothetical protein [Yersinia alsatica]